MATSVPAAGSWEAARAPLLLCAAVLAAAAARALAEWAWLRPRRLGRALRAQGLRGTSYRFPSGDLAEDERLLAAERTKPMLLLSHAISARVEPLLHSIVKEHGTSATESLKLPSNRRVDYSNSRVHDETLG